MKNFSQNYSTGWYSKKIFGNLKENDYRILKNIAKEGFLSITKIAEKTNAPSYSKDPFDRCAVKSKVEGSSRFFGLEPAEYVYSIKINKKETKFGLTIKGICAVLPEVKFEEIFIVKKYRKFLHNLTDDNKIVNWSMKFIETEITLILAYNFIQGIDWTKFKYVKNYWNDFKEYDDRVVQKFFIDKIFRTHPEYVLIQRDYLKLFFILDKCTESINCSFNSDWHAGIEINNPIRLHVDRWYLFIDRYKHGRFPIRDNWEHVDENIFFDREFWLKSCHRPMIEANKILKNEGYQK